MNEITLRDVIKEYDEVTLLACSLNLLCRDTNLQIKAVKKLNNLLLKIKVIKHYIIDDPQFTDEDVNTWFYFQCITNANIKSLEIWINIKSNKDNKFLLAWDSLVEAQSYMRYAFKFIPENAYGTEELYNHIISIEKSGIFPKLQFVSSGLVTNGGQCSICNMIFEECVHIEDQLYRGKICKRVDIQIAEVNHVAFVENPEDRRCFITKVEVNDGKMKDVFTHTEDKIRSKEKKQSVEIEGTSASMRCLTFNSLDIF
jgi:hypothetical protein